MSEYADQGPYQRLDELVDTDPIQLRDEAWAYLKRAEKAEAAIERVRAVHREDTGCCDECVYVDCCEPEHEIWPCTTIQAIDPNAHAHAVRQRHMPRGGDDICDWCATAWPCPIYAALDQPGEGQ